MKTLDVKTHILLLHLKFWCYLNLKKRSPKNCPSSDTIFLLAFHCHFFPVFPLSFVQIKKPFRLALLELLRQLLDVISCEFWTNNLVNIALRLH